ncbi:MAG TPA: L-histidine N(alpha)-methyltransferase [Nitrososphaeraceae archaeon]|nr:L-histidine N(alpha)-methyltransferase [Nitrososphaeraceae archaeon]
MSDQNNSNTLIDEFARDVKYGLGRKRKRLDPKYFYDKTGSELFESICTQPEYYLTRTEYKIILKNIGELVNYFDNQNVSIIELGSGSSKKTKIILKYFLEKQENKLHYFPIDVSYEMLFNSNKKLLKDFPKITSHPISSDYFDGIRQANEYIHSNGNIPDKKLILFFGSSLGNFEPKYAISFLRSIRKGLAPDDSFLIGFDLVKKKEVLEAAYNDGNGITAQFNLNILRRINNELDGEFDLESFKHFAYFNEKKSRIEMHLVSKIKQNVKIGKINKSFNFLKNESIHTENSYKYKIQDIKKFAKKSNMKVEKNFLDDNNWFSLSLLVPN